MPRPKFTLRALLIAMLVVCIWLGWAVERARRRGEAMDAAADAGFCVINYLNDDLTMLSDSQGDHFWLDLRSIPVAVELKDQAWSEDTLTPATTVVLSRISGIRLVDFYSVNSRRRRDDGKKRRAEIQRTFPDAGIAQSKIVY